jgi:hypothetical protein
VSPPAIAMAVKHSLQASNASGHALGVEIQCAQSRQSHAKSALTGVMGTECAPFSVHFLVLCLDTMTALIFSVQEAAPATP